MYLEPPHDNLGPYSVLCYPVKKKAILQKHCYHEAVNMMYSDAHKLDIRERLLSSDDEF